MSKEKNGTSMTSAERTPVENGETLSWEGQKTSSTLLPCIEQPLRVALHCNGYYLRGLKKGSVAAYTKQSEKDEFRLTYENDGSGIVKFHNHKYGGALAVVTDDHQSKKVVCVQDEKKEAVEKIKDEVTYNNDAADNNDGSYPGEFSSKYSSNEVNSLVDDEEEDDDEVVVINSNNVREEDKQWYFVKSASVSDKIILKSWSTGDNVGIDGKGNIVFASENPDADPNTVFTWDIECVTGELCYISNAKLDCRVRCDLNGMLFLTDAWKGWEVFRVMEASHGYVKISSWMHSQWLLCSAADGTVSTCSHVESLLEDNPKGRCSKWAMEKSINDMGVIIRNKTYGRVLSIHDGILKTYDPIESNILPIELENTDATNDQSEEEETLQQSAKKWWNNSLRNVNDSMKKSKIKVQKEFSRASVKSDLGNEDAIQEKDTTVWQLEAAHLQTYYFINSIQDDDDSPKSIGPFPEVTCNLRKTDKIQLIRETSGVIKLYLSDQEQYISCLADGSIEFVKEANDAKNDFIMEKSSQHKSGSLFRSKLYNLYLSYEEESITEDEEIDIEEATEVKTKSSQSVSSKINESFNNLLSSRGKVSKLIGTKTINGKETWRLEPSMPRAVSSQKIKTFALGTSIAVGTTIAMPFALAGMGALLGAVGAEVGIVANVIAVGLTGAEALASVGAIGATAYIVFRPEENSLTDDHNKNEDEEEQAWSHRPFSNWRNW